ncbi:RNA polymerase-binding protein RbpA [Actinosynnema sp. NPDC047251]|uniref:RNA polymerase-binding protein RbpA n=1 Tax=Saccharothrix espanaensis (strain ATCC 51144 / DSM 44229 / JCM 9112 / NBRC 15066 / NRRL 15764) TaxID=1179773 RepID=K0JUU1_SACES|nr:RNA polymerase-binding protein RbpA [Saccharothrix espanaensis]CCH31590.1 hypothetical protein BN6_43070 [Saccharothrix espanaensis DSM 44229]
MADRVLRGSRLGAVSYETDRNHDLAPRRSVRYACPKNHDFEVPFSDDAEIPHTWECRLHGTESKIIDGAEPEAKKVKPPRTHWDMLLERRTIPELEELLDERLEELKGRRTRTA